MATVAEILLARGEQQANQRRRQGEISGQMWRSLGDIAQQVGQNYQRQQDEAPRRAMEKIALDNAQQQRAGQAVIDKAMQPYQPVGPQPEGDAPAPAQHPYLDDQTGLADPQKLTDLLSAHGMAHLAPSLLQGVEAQNKAITDFKTHQEEAGTKHAIMLGSVANTTLKLMDAGMPFDQAAQHASSSLIATGAADPKMIQQQIAQISQLPPDQQTAQLKELKATASRLGPKKTVGKDAIEKDMFDETTASNIVAPPPTEASIAMQAAGGDPNVAMGLLKPTSNKPSAEQDTQRAVDIRMKVSMGQAVPPADVAWLKSHETEKTLGVDLTAGMASNRQATAIAAQTAQQARAQNFQEQQQGRKELTEKVEAPYQTAASSAQTLRDTVALARSGNMTAAALQNLETTMSAIRAQGLNRINTAEIGSTANAGSLWDNIVGRVGKLTAGQPVDAALQKDMQQFAGMLEKAAYKKYRDGHASITKRYNLTDEKPLAGPDVHARGADGVLHTAPYGTPIPPGATEE